MEKTIVLKDNQIETLINFLEQEQEKLRGEILKKEAQLRENDKTLEILKATDVKSSSITAPLFHANLNGNTVKNEYDKNWSWTKKAVFVLRIAGVPLTVAEIVDLIYKYEPSLKSDDGTDLLRSHRGSVSANISVIAKRKNHFNLQRGSFTDGEFRYYLNDYKKKGVDNTPVTY